LCQCRAWGPARSAAPALVRWARVRSRVMFALSRCFTRMSASGSRIVPVIVVRGWLGLGRPVWIELRWRRRPILRLLEEQACHGQPVAQHEEIGRASCRERVYTRLAAGLLS